MDAYSMTPPLSSVSIKWILLPFTPLVLFIAWKWLIDYYEYAIVDKAGNEAIVLRIPKSSTAIYPGWEYKRNSAFSVDLWYPSLKDKVSANYWISSASRINASKTKPGPDEEKLGISVIHTDIRNPESTLDVNRTSYCDTSLGIFKYTKDSESELFQRYIHDSPGSARLDIIYLPINPIKGVDCIQCVENGNCKIIGITDSGIPYSAFFTEKRIPDETIKIHHAVNAYLESKRVK